VNGISDIDSHGDLCPIFGQHIANSDTDILLELPALGNKEQAA
jgi:hypothetical protein